jgi:hypothetical protein
VGRTALYDMHLMYFSSFSVTSGDETRVHWRVFVSSHKPSDRTHQITAYISRFLRREDNLVDSVTASRLS